MLITIRKFDSRPPQLLPGSSILGYWIDFTADRAGGSALLVPAGSGIEELRQGSPFPQIFVETGQKGIEGFRLLTETEAHVFQFEALSHPGDYEVTGEIRSVLVQEDGKIDHVSVWVESCRFDLTAGDRGSVDVEAGEWVQFRVIELALYDENL